MLEVAAYGVPSELTEDDVMVAVVARPGRRIDPVDLVAFCENSMARHMLPRYVDIVDALPKTPTEKVEKYRLAARGPSATTWDRERVILTSAGDENDDKATDQAQAPDN